MKKTYMTPHSSQSLEWLSDFLWSLIPSLKNKQDKLVWFFFYFQQNYFISIFDKKKSIKY